MDLLNPLSIQVVLGPGRLWGGVYGFRSLVTCRVSMPLLQKFHNINLKDLYVYGGGNLCADLVCQERDGFSHYANSGRRYE